MRNILLLLGALALAGAASAQLRLPSVNLPSGLGPLDSLRVPAQRLVERIDLPDLRTLRQDTVGQLLRRHPDVLEADPHGEPALRGEILAWDPAAAALDAARANGLRVAREERFEELGQTLVVLRVPDSAPTAQVLERLRSLDPDGHYDFNHIYTGSGALPAQAQAQVQAQDGAASDAEAHGAPKVGLVDSGVDRAHRALRASAVQTWGCAGAAHPSAHGTAVAALLVGRDGHFRGAAPGAQLYAADVFCGDDPGGGSVERIAAALAWLAREQVGVINLSLVGPPNQALERVVGAMVKRGHLLVAAVGNDGPAAAPLYPASYPGVVGVTAISRNGEPLPEAARGPQVLFAAPGNNMISAAPGDPPYRQVRGTSFAAPIVAGLLAPKLARPDRARAHQALAALAGQASGVQGGKINNSLGYGIVGGDVRTDPAWLR
jgi:subtilisin family serine protease